MTCLIAVIGLVAVGGAKSLHGQQNANRFFQAIEDLPLMPGLSEQEEETVVFDTAQGRLVETLAVGGSSPQTVEAFYEETLPQLGWVRTQERTYRRQGELLSYRLWGPEKPGEKTRIRFNLAPLAP